MARIRSFFSSGAQQEAQGLYIALVKQSREVFFYTDAQVPDSLDGRFEIIVLHMFLMLQALKAQGGREELSRNLQECFFSDMDRSLREMGVGDMGVAKRIKKMSKAAYGRFEVYTQVFADDAALAEALGRNVYRSAEVAPEALAKLFAYVRGWRADGLINS